VQLTAQLFGPFLRCTSSFGGTTSFTAVAGQTYYFQVGSDQSRPSAGISATVRPGAGSIPRIGTRLMVIIRCR